MDNSKPYTSELRDWIRESMRMERINIGLSFMKAVTRNTAANRMTCWKKIDNEVITLSSLRPLALLVSSADLDCSSLLWTSLTSITINDALDMHCDTISAFSKLPDLTQARFNHFTPHNNSFPAFCNALKACTQLSSLMLDFTYNPNLTGFGDLSANTQELSTLLETLSRLHDLTLMVSQDTFLELLPPLKLPLLTRLAMDTPYIRKNQAFFWQPSFEGLPNLSTLHCTVHHLGVCPTLCDNLPTQLLELTLNKKYMFDSGDHFSPFVVDQVLEKLLRLPHLHFSGDAFRHFSDAPTFFERLPATQGPHCFLNGVELGSGAVKQLVAVLPNCPLWCEIDWRLPYIPEAPVLIGLMQGLIRQTCLETLSIRGKQYYSSTSYPGLDLLIPELARFASLERLCLGNFVVSANTFIGLQHVLSLKYLLLEDMSITPLHAEALKPMFETVKLETLRMPLDAHTTEAAQPFLDALCCCTSLTSLHLHVSLASEPPGADCLPFLRQLLTHLTTLTSFTFLSDNYSIETPWRVAIMHLLGLNLQNINILGQQISCGGTENNVKRHSTLESKSVFRGPVQPPPAEL